MEYHQNLFVKETSFYNELVLGNILPGSLWKNLPHTAQSWLRTWIGAILIYFVSSFISYLFVCSLIRLGRASKDTLPSKKGAIFEQIWVGIKGLPVYCALPVFSEYVVEQGWTQAYSSISEVGWALYLTRVFTYLMVCEVLVYWTHRKLHEIKPLYKLVHAKHHIYNKQNTISPFAGVAFSPLDGIIEGFPHVITMFIVPTHFTTHIALLLFEAIWAANIHDNIHGKVWPIMGAGYHTIHHTRYRHNYGHYTVLMDWMFGTLICPEDDGKRVDCDLMMDE